MSSRNFFKRFENSSDHTGSNDTLLMSDEHQRITECSPTTPGPVANIQYSITFRPIQESDRDDIKKLHEELFPVEYTNNFYDSVVQNLGMDEKPLFSCIAVAREDDEEHSTSNQNCYDAWRRFANDNGVDNLHVDGLYDRWIFTESVSLEHLSSSCREVLQGGRSIVACIVGTFMDVSSIGQETAKQLVLNPHQHTRYVPTGTISTNFSFLTLSANTTYSTCIITQRMFYIMTLGSLENFRGRGLGSKLINECINICEQVPSCGVIYLHVITYNSTAIRFYERLGFHRIKEIKDYYTINNESYNCYLYAKFVNGKVLCIFG